MGYTKKNTSRSKNNIKVIKKIKTKTIKAKLDSPPIIPYSSSSVKEFNVSYDKNHKLNSYDLMSGYNNIYTVKIISLTSEKNKTHMMTFQEIKNLISEYSHIENIDNFRNVKRGLYCITDKTGDMPHYSLYKKGKCGVKLTTTIKKMKKKVLITSMY